MLDAFIGACTSDRVAPDLVLRPDAVYWTLTAAALGVLAPAFGFNG